MDFRKQVRKVYIQKPSEHESRLVRALRMIGFLFVSSAILLGAVLGGGYWWLARDLPQIEEISDYRPNVVSYVYDRQGQVIGEFKYENQTRILVKLPQVPQHLINAFIAAEDKNFYKHKGVDLLGFVRAMLKNLRKGSLSEGGSTITQQLTRALLLSPEKTIRRKLREMLLAQKIESNFDKHEILYLYLNEIYFGSGAYGVQAAAQVYFGKDVIDLSLAECAILAGLPQAPSRYSPSRNPQEAKRRQHYVLERMAANGYITQAESIDAFAEQIKLAQIRDMNLENAPYFTEHVRRYVMEVYGSDKVLKDGLHIYTTVDMDLQHSAQKALDYGLREFDKRKGWRGPIRRESSDRVPAALQELLETQTKAEPPVPDDLLTGIVTVVDDQRKTVVVDTGVALGTIAFNELKWAELMVSGETTRQIKLAEPGQLLKAGDVVEVRVLKTTKDLTELALEQKPLIQGALVSVDPRNFELLAMVGGNDYESSEFNRAVQAFRQPGSAFKPIVYAAAMDAGFTPASTILDTALVFADGWKPKNYGGGFQGEIRLRQALAKSVNTVTVRLLGELGTAYVLDYARRLGMELSAKDDLSVALGSYETTLLDLTYVYTTFASGGLRADPIFIRRIQDRDGKIIEDHLLADRISGSDGNLAAPRTPDSTWLSQGHPEAEPQPEQDSLNEEDEDLELIVMQDDDPQTGEVFVRRVMSRQTAYVVTSMLQSVVREGTGTRALALGRQAAGKTGTTNNNIDAWFVGYTPLHLAGVWVGYDEGGKTMGSKETGTRAALPIWLHYMKQAVKKMPDQPFQAPPGIVFEKIDPESGLLATPETKNPLLECFKAGTAPTEYANQEAAPKAGDFFRYDTEVEKQADPLLIP